MKMYFKRILVVAAFIIGASASPALSQNKADQDKGILLPSDSVVHVGTLPNGFKYYLRRNMEPAKRATFYLVSKAGSILEEDNERGLAHFVEHMAFNGTKNYPKHALVDYLQKTGVKFGADLNAYTSFDETVYQLPIPTEDPNVVKNGLQIMRDWAQDVLMEDDEIAAERGVILEEKRLRKGVGARIQEIIFPILMNHSRYADRLPIGTDEVLKDFKPETIRQFYTKWYRPDLQALIVVGDIDVNTMEKMIKEKFADLDNKSNAPKRTNYTIPLSNKNNFISITDPEVPSTSLQLLIKFPSTTMKTENDIRNSMIKTFFNGILSLRLEELSKQDNPPFLGTNIGFGTLSADLDAMFLNVGTKPGELERGFKAALTELERVRQNGFTQTELDRVKQSFINGQEYSHKEQDKTPSAAYVQQYVQVFLKGQANPSADFVYEFYKNNIDGIKLGEVNSLINQFDFKNNRDIILTAPETEKGKLPNEETILGWIKNVQESAITAYQDADYNKPLITNLPAKGKIVKETINDKVGITKWVLSNGVKVVLKPTNFKNDQIILSSFSPGGTSLYGDSDYQSAINAAGIISASGLGEFDSKELPKVLSGKIASVAPYIGERFEGISGESNVKDLPTALQLIYLYFTSPRLDDAVIKGILGNAKSSIANRYNSPGNVFADTINAVLGNYNFRSRPPTLEAINDINPGRSLEIFKERFSDASDFTFVFTGSFNIDSMRPLMEQYLATLPVTHRKEAGKDLGITIPVGEITKTVYKGKEEKATVQLVLSGNYKFSEASNWNMKALEEILKIKLIDRLREKEGGVYSSDVSISYEKFPKQRYTVSISFGCAPENVDKLVKATREEMESIINNGPGKTDLEKYKAEEKLSIELQLKTNNYWQYNIVSRFENNEDPDEILKDIDYLNKVTEKTVKAAAQKYFSTKNIIKFVLLPEVK